METRFCQFALALARTFQNCSDANNNVSEHGYRQQTGISIVARTMVAVSEDQAARQCVMGAMGEFPCTLLFAERRQYSAVCQSAQCQDHAEPRHRGDLIDQKRPARRDLGAYRLVLRRYTAHSVGDAAIHQFKAVVGALIVGALGKPGRQQRRIEEIAGIIAGKRASGEVGPLQARRQTDDQETRIEFTKRRYRRIVPVWVLEAMAFKEHMKARAKPANTIWALKRHAGIALTL